MGWSATVTSCEAPGAMTPAVQLSARWEVSGPLPVMDVTVSGALPALLIVNVAVAVCSTSTWPNARLPASTTTRVTEGTGDGDGAVGVPPEQAASASGRASARTRRALSAPDLPIGRSLVASTRPKARTSTT